jgi:hypothetical protein
VGALIVEDIEIGPRDSTSFGLKDDLGRDHWIERDDNDPTYLDPQTYSGHVQPTPDGKAVCPEIARGGRMCWNGAAFALDNMIEAYRAVCEKKFGGVPQRRAAARRRSQLLRGEQI